MVDKLKLVTISFQHSGSYITSVYVVDYSTLKSYLSSCRKLSYLKKYYRLYHPIPLKMDLRGASALILYYLLHILSDIVFDSLGNYRDINFRIRTLSSATSNRIYSDDLALESLNSTGLFFYSTFLNGEFLSNAMLSSTLCLSEHLFKSGDWKEYNIIPKEKF